MQRETSDILTKFTVDGAMAAALEFEANRRQFDDSMEARAGLIIEQLGQAGFQIVRKGDVSKWETGFRSVAGALFYDPKAPCDIEAIAREVRELRNIVPPLSDEADRRTECMTFCEDDDSWVVSGTADDVRKVLDLISEAEAARKLAKASAIRGTSIETNSGTIDLPRSVARVTVATDTTPDGTNVCTFGWSDSGTECWLLNHTFVPSLRAAA